MIFSKDNYTMEYCWRDDDDIRNDLCEMSVFCNTPPEPSPEPSDYMKRLRGTASIFEDVHVDNEPQEDKYVFIPVRGHPLLNGDGIIIRRPGPTFHQQQTSASIREATGFGYGNDLIEHAFKPANSEDEKDPDKMRNVSFCPSPKKAASKKSSEESDGSFSSSSSLSEQLWRSSTFKGNNSPDIRCKKEFPALP